MKKKQKENKELTQDKTLTPLLYSNSIKVFASESQGIILNFGTNIPSYDENYDTEDSLIAQIFLSWEGCKGLAGILNETISDYEENHKPKQEAKSKTR